MRRHEGSMRRLVNLIFFSFVFVAFLSLGASAQTSCPADQVIMRISGLTNAHGEVHNFPNSNYNYKICYNDIFSGNLYSGANPQSCTPNRGNDVLRLSGNTNAHAETPGSTTSGYTDVCYGDLVCVSTTAANCPGLSREVVSLSSSTNAHIGFAGQYGTKICCSTTPQSITNPIWKYYNNLPIPDVNPNTLICPNSYPIMSVTTSGITNGVVDFELWDDSTGPDTKILPQSTSSSFSVLQGTVSNNQANVTLNLNNSELFGILESARGSSGGELELYFKAIYPNINPINSYEVDYRGNPNACSYLKPTVEITAPVHKGVYFKDTQINFEGDCRSQLGPLQYEWTITPQTGAVVTKTEPRFNHLFTSSGQANVKLKCTDPRGQYSIKESQILIVDNDKKMFAYINQPAFDSFVDNLPPSSGPYFPTQVTFSATDSFAVGVTPAVSPSTCPTVQCLGGSCRTQTQNSPDGCSNPISITSAPTNYANLFFNWTFWDNNWNEQWNSYEGRDVENGAVNYDDVSNSVNDKHMSVLVNYSVSNNPSVSASATFQRDFTLGRCLNNGNTFHRSSNEVLSTTAPNNACKGINLVENRDDCCPSGHQCLPTSTSSNSPYSCQPSSSTATNCRDLTRSECNSNTNPALPLASYGRNPAVCEFLQCYWITTGPNANTCGVRATQYANGQNGCNVGSNACPTYDCAWTTTQTECVNGIKTISYSSASSIPVKPGCAIGSATACQRDEVTVPCGSLNFELSFFGKTQFIISIISIFILYLLLNFYKGRVHEKNK